MFLTEDELYELTGYRMASKQVKHLKAQRIPFHTNRAGHPRVARAIIEGGGVKAMQAAAAPKPTWNPSGAAAQA
jgi:Domain of unknown function (DUF4224)